jgi:hypothetical protein
MRQASRKLRQQVTRLDGGDDLNELIERDVAVLREETGARG